MKKGEEAIRKLAIDYWGAEADRVESLTPTGSNRHYFRIHRGKKSILGVYNEDLQENHAYISFSKAFYKEGIKVPEILKVQRDEKSYLVEDLGKTSLWDLAGKDVKKTEKLSESSLELYKKSLSELHKLQKNGLKSINLNDCYPRKAFDKQSMLWDLNYFKYMFLRVMGISSDEELLERDIQKLSDELDAVDQDYFLYRDFQSRNIMIREGEAYFIDFQGGRKGTMYYDLASLLYDANVELGSDDRNQLLNYYFSIVKDEKKIDREEFEHHFYRFAVIRLCQALGAFVLRGVIEKKPHFEECIPYAVKALKEISEETALVKDYPELSKAIDASILKLKL